MGLVKKVVMLTDLEGVAGITSFEDQAFSSGRYYDSARRLLTAEVNAAIDGLMQAGVEEALVIDGHGAGGIAYEELHERATLLHGRPLAPWHRLAPVIADHDAAILVGQHAMAGAVTGVLSHTQSSRTIDYYRLNDQPIGETAQFALCCGELGVPVILLTGDADACAEARELISDIVTVAVKQGLGRTTAISLSPTQARRAIREGATLAIAKHNRSPLTPLRWPGPYTLEIRYFFTTDADARASQAGAERVDDRTIRFTGDSLLEIIYR